MPNQQPASLEEIGREIYQNKPVFFTLLALAGVVVYLAYRHFSTSSAPAPAVVPPQPANTPSGATISNSYTR